MRMRNLILWLGLTVAATGSFVTAAQVARHLGALIAKWLPSRTPPGCCRRPVAATAAEAGPADRDGPRPLRGQVIDERGQPAPAVQVVSVIEERVSPVAYTDEAGHFELGGARGPVLLYAYRGGASARLAGTFRPGDRATLRLLPPGRVEGTVVVRGGGPLPGNLVAWKSVAGAPVPLPGFWDANPRVQNGRFVLPAAPAGELVVHVLGRGSPPLSGHARVQVDPGGLARVTVELEPADTAIQGRVGQAGSDEQVSDYAAALLLEDGTLEAFYPPRQPFFRFEARTPGRRFILLTSPRHYPLRLPIHVSSGKVTDLGEVRLQPR